MRRRLGLVFGALALTLGVLTVPSPAAAWTRPPVRVAGDDRYATAVQLSAAAFPDGADAAVIASGESFPDGLAAGPLAALRDAPVLLTESNALPGVTAAELDRLAPTSIAIVGGPAAVSDDVLAAIEVRTGVTVERIAGPNRYETATAVASLFAPNLPVAFVASGADFPDALAGGAAASLANAPLLLVPPDALPAAVGDQLARLASPDTIVLGGPGAVSDAVVAAIDERVAGVRRLAGADRYATAAAVAADRAPNATDALLATGETFPDALAAAPLARTLGAPILLTAGCEPAGTVDYLRARGWADVTVVGGTGAVPEFGLSLPCSPVPDGEVTPGVNLITRVLPGPNVVKLVTVDRTRGAQMRPVMAAGRLVGRLTTTEIARGNDVPVAINGTFFLSSGEPSFAFATGGRLVKAPGAGGTLLALDPARPTYAQISITDFSIHLDVEGADPLEIDRVNSGAPGSGEVGMFTTEDHRTVDVGTEYCRSLLDPRSAPVIDADGVTEQQLVVTDVGCSAEPITTVDHDVVAALAGTTDGDLIEQLTLGDVVTVGWSAHPDIEGALDLIGGNLALVYNGAVSTDVTVNSGPFFTERAPRTAVGIYPDGGLLMVIVDGRQAPYSVGLTPRELADFMVSLGVRFAVNLDGGGSTSLAVHGVLANHPSDTTGQRPVGSALLVVPPG